MTVAEAIKRVKSVYPDAKINRIHNGMSLLYSRASNINIMNYDSSSEFAASDDKAWIMTAEYLDRELLSRLEQ